MKRGSPDFIEIKGVTFCGDSKASDLTMSENVPYHEEVVAFAKVGTPRHGLLPQGGPNHLGL